MKSPANPVEFNHDNINVERHYGLSKLELGALMMVQGLISANRPINFKDCAEITRDTLKACDEIKL